VFVGTSKHRRVLGVGNGYVIYSNGGNANRECRVATFTRWIKRQKAVKQEQA
jgi:hypothetical protein